MPSTCSLRLVAFTLLFFAAWLPAADKPAAVKSPLSPEESLKHFHLDEGLRIEIVASEPQVVDPVAMRFDENGRLWVVEMRDYPDPPAPGELAKSRIKLLEDRDGDGRYETAHVFADNLLFATGVQPWQGGVIATISGKIIYLKDTDGDNKADINETWFTGFTEENPQLRVNHPRFALDNHIYVASGLRGGMVLATREPKAEPISLRNRDLRFDPRGKTCEAVSGNGQFGLTFDDYGNRFICSNRNPLMHVVLEDRYLGRNPFLAIPAVTNDVAASGEASHVYPISQAWTTSHLHAGQFTAACGVDIYRGDALPAEYRGNAFTCEPTGSLVHREIIQPVGATFTSKPAKEGVEFLASPDTWFRPVNIEGGPDGALYVVDMYRAVIEHPQFMPEELKKRPDLRYGDDRGRIYRIVPKDWKNKNPAPKLADVPSADLVKLFERDGAWWRETAQRLLYQRQDKTVTELLEKNLKDNESPKARIHSLWTLRGLNSCREGNVVPTINDGHPRVREQGLVVLEDFLSHPSSLPPLSSMTASTSQDDSRVRFQQVLTFGNLDGNELISLLVHTLSQGANDVWARRAVMTSTANRAGAVLVELVRSLGAYVAANGTVPDGSSLAIQELALLVGSRRDNLEIATVTRAIVNLGASASAERLQSVALTGIAQGMRSRGMTIGDFAKQNEADYPQITAALKRWFDRSIAVASEIHFDDSQRNAACESLAFAPYDLAAPVLTKIIEKETSQELRLKAVSALASQRDTRVGQFFLDQIPSQTPSVRRVMLDAMLGQTERINLLLDEIESGKLKATELDSLKATRLIKNSNPKIAERAKKLLASALPPDRAAAVEKYRAALALKPDAKHGKEVFRKNCSTCHKIDDVGVDVGPSIGDARTKTTEQILIDILQPSRAIDNNFMSYSVVTADGLAYTGIIIAETATSVTLKLPEAKTVSLLRSNIDELRSNGVSLMPEGLERNIPLQDMADCIAFIKNWRYLSGDVPVVEAAK
jgi:putative membrane-bound dehydrogenase-like protein